MLSSTSRGKSPILRNPHGSKGTEPRGSAQQAQQLPLGVKSVSQQVLLSAVRGWLHAQGCLQHIHPTSTDAVLTPHNAVPADCHACTSEAFCCTLDEWPQGLHCSVCL